MVRQYIGARYVPKFYENSAGTSEWRAGVIYEPLTIVTYNGNSYTSKKAVPAEIGDPSANPEYWAATGLYNEQVEALREQVSDLDTELSQEITDRENAIAALAQTEIVWIGDSYVEANSLGADQNKRFSTLVSQALGLTEHNYAEGGSDFISGGSSGVNYIGQLQNAIADMTEDERNHTKYLVVASTRNMPYNNPNATLSDYNSAISGFFTAARAAFPKSIMIFVPMLWSAEPLIFSYRKCLQWCIQCGLNCNPPIVTVQNAYLWNLGHYGNILDGVHPNVDGHRLIACELYNSIMGISDEPAPIVTTELSPESGINGAAHIIVKKDHATIRVQFTASSTIPSGGVIIPETGLGANYGFITGASWYFSAISNTGTPVALQLNNYYSGGTIKFGIKAASSIPAGTYNGMIHLYNGFSY